MLSSRFFMLIPPPYLPQPPCGSYVSFCIGCRSRSLSPLPQRRRCRPQCMRLRLLAAAQSHNCPPRWGRRLTVPSAAKRSRLHTLKVESTRLSCRFLYCLVRRRISRTRRSVLPVIVNASFRFLFPGSINDPLLLKRHEIQNPSTQNRKKFKKIEPPRIWDGSVHEICTYSKEMFPLGSSCFAAYRQRRSSDGKRYPAVFHTPSAVMSRL